MTVITHFTNGAGITGMVMSLSQAAKYPERLDGKEDALWDTGNWGILYRVNNKQEALKAIEEFKIPEDWKEPIDMTGSKPVVILIDTSFGSLWAEYSNIIEDIKFAYRMIKSCEAVSIYCQVFMVASNSGNGYESKWEEHLWMIRFDSFTEDEAYAAVCSTDMFRYLFIRAEAADLYLHKYLRDLEGGKNLVGATFSSRTGGHAVTWAREAIPGDNFIIAIGNILDRDQADLAMKRTPNG